MSKFSEILLEGSYVYFNKDVNYSQENFKLAYSAEEQIYQFYAEILSRIETGEFLKILVRYEMNSHFVPFQSRIERSIGNKYAMESYKIDLTNFEMRYNFNDGKNSQDFVRGISAKHYLTSPAVCTSAVFTLTKKFDATGRTPVTILSSENDWTYAGPPTEKIIYAEFKSRDLNDFKLHGNTLSASHLCLYEFDSSHAATEQPVNLYLSKHFSVPYELIQGDQKIVIKNLKKH